MCHCWNLFRHQESVIPFLTHTRVCSAVLKLLPASRAPASAQTAVAFPQLCGHCISSCFLCFPGGQQAAFKLSCHFQPLESPASCSSPAGPGLWWRRAGAGWGPGVLTVLAAALGSGAPAVLVPGLRNVMDAPVTDVGHVPCVATALLYKAAVTSAQTHPCTVQIV